MNNPCPQCKGKCCRNIDSGYRVLHMAAQVYMHDCDYCDDGSAIMDNESKVCSCYECNRHGCPCTTESANDPSLDGTDLAHLAWWRGCDSGADSTIVVIHQMLDDIEAGKEKAGTFGSQKLNMLRDRLYQMYGK
jgi:hypothetical protein